MYWEDDVGLSRREIMYTYEKKTFLANLVQNLQNIRLVLAISMHNKEAITYK